MSASGQEARRAADEAFIQDRNFEEILGQRPSLEVIIIRFADAAEEGHWAGPAKLELQHAEHEAFSFENLLDRVAAVNHVDDLLDRRAVDLFVLGGNKQCSRTDQLKFAKGDNFARQKTINKV